MRAQPPWLARRDFLRAMKNNQNNTQNMMFSLKRQTATVNIFPPQRARAPVHE